MGLPANHPKSRSSRIEAVPRHNAETAAASANSALMIQAQDYLLHRQKGLPPSQNLQVAWRAFYDVYSRKIRSYAFTCGASEEDVADCIQDVWTELLVRLPAFRLNPDRGKFDTWLFHIVRGKTVDLRRRNKHRFLREKLHTLQNALDYESSPACSWEEEEMLALTLVQLKKSLTECTFQVLQLRLVENRTVAEVAEMLGLSHEQVWYRYHRAVRKLKAIGSAYSGGCRVLPPPAKPLDEKHEKDQEFAQGKAACSVSRSAATGQSP